MLTKISAAVFFVGLVAAMICHVVDASIWIELGCGLASFLACVHLTVKEKSRI